MNCVNHADVAAMGACQACGRPLCSLCVYFRAGQIVCDRHAGADGSVTATGAGAGSHDVAAPDPAHGPIAGTNVAPPAPVYVVDPRLEPLPMAQRPGWPDEPAQHPPSTLAETLGLVGLILGVVALPFSICCGFGAVVGAPLALLGGGLAIAALIKAPGTRNPPQARWMGGIGVGLNALDLGISICYVAAFAVITTGTLSGPFLQTLTAVPTP